MIVGTPVKMLTEEQLLEPEFRKKVIQEIMGSENVWRKNEALRAYELLNGHTKKWVVEALAQEFSPETVVQMKNRATNIPVFKKVVKKLAQTYVGGVDRKAQLDSDQEAVDEIAESVNLNGVQEKVDRFFEAFRNVLLMVVPVKNFRETNKSEGGKPLFDLELRVLAPHFYDVIPDADDPTKARAIILTDFVERGQGTPLGNPSSPDFRGKDDGVVNQLYSGDGQQETIAEPNDDDEGRQRRLFIWWSDKYHFTTLQNGEYYDKREGGLTPPDMKNPIEELPFVTYAGDQDGHYYAQGWQDRVDGAVHINVTLTDMFCIAMVQGWGQPVLIAEKMPEKVVGGPHRAICLKAEKGGVEPKFQYASSNPPLNEWMGMVELDVALYLSTNDLSPSTVASKLDAKNFASGIAMMIERSESTADIQAKQTMFQGGENRTLKLINAWQKTLSESKSLTEKFAKLKVLADPTVNLDFHQVKPVVSEGDHVDTLTKRKALGLNTMVDLIKKDNPGITDQEAEKKKEELLAERQEMQAMFPTPDPNDPNAAKPGAPGAPGQKGAPGQQGNGKQRPLPKGKQQSAPKGNTNQPDTGEDDSSDQSD
jgi:hypothetical protein